MRFSSIALMGLALAAGMVGGAVGAGVVIADSHPQMREQVDRDRLAVHRLDIVDSGGVIRMTLAAAAPEPRIGGKAYKRVFPAAGLTFYDSGGDERGGMAVADVPGSAIVLASDHANTDAVGWIVKPDGSVAFMMNERPPIEHDPDGALKPALSANTRISMTLAPDGTPAIALSDKQNRPRVTITITPEGYGALEFLDAEGKVVRTMIPEQHAQ